MLVQHGNNDDAVGVREKVYGKWEAADEGAAQIGVDFGEVVRRLGHSLENLVDLGNEFLA